MADPILDIDLAEVQANRTRANLAARPAAKKAPAVERDPLRKLGGRKFFLTFFAFVVTTILVAVGILPPEEFRWVVATLLLTYVAGNVTQKATAPAPQEQSPAPPPSYPPTY